MTDERLKCRLKRNIATYITDGAKINKLTDFVLHKVLMKHSEENHL